jgi:HPt (histidine-containing phosphotransfer) domain-containing protein
MDTSETPKDLEWSDLSFLRNYSGGDKELMKKFIQTFLTRTPETILQMESALAIKDFHAVTSLAHNLRPQLSYMGVAKATDLVKSIEESAKATKETESLSAKLEAVKEIVLKAYEELQQELRLL